MSKFFFKVKENKKGISLLVAVLVAGVALLVGLAISNIALKEVILTQSSKDSQVAFYASNSGVECGLFEDLRNRVFDPDDSPGSLTCNNQTTGVQFQEIFPGSDQHCTGGEGHEGCWEATLSEGEILLGSDQNDPCFNLRAVKEKFEVVDGEDVITYFTTALESRGYNTCNQSSPRRLERAIRAIY